MAEAPPMTGMPKLETPNGKLVREPILVAFHECPRESNPRLSGRDTVLLVMEKKEARICAGQVEGGSVVARPPASQRRRASRTSRTNTAHNKRPSRFWCRSH